MNQNTLLSNQSDSESLVYHFYNLFDHAAQHQKIVIFEPDNAWFRVGFTMDQCLLRSKKCSKCKVVFHNIVIYGEIYMDNSHKMPFKGKISFRRFHCDCFHSLTIFERGIDLNTVLLSIKYQFQENENDAENDSEEMQQTDNYTIHKTRTVIRMFSRDRFAQD